MKNKEVSGLEGTSQNVGLHKLQKVLLISNFNVLQGQWCARSQVSALNRKSVRSIVGSVLERT